MKFIADFHIHSHFSLATSKNLTPEHLDYWAGLKGINIIGTGDAVHPGWLQELKEKLEPAGNGLYRLKEIYTLDRSRALFKNGLFARPNFILTAEISSIYKKAGKVRKIHSICVFPDFAAVEKMQARLEKIGNIRSDGRPILGLDAKTLLELLLETSGSSFLIPAHIWTPWFSVLGSKSGFDSIEECYEDLTPDIFAVETGLSSDPAMNWACSFLDRFRLVSNSDAHSPEKIGREANIFDTELSYAGVFNALKTGSGFTGTIEFHPQEGKYHYDGHRKCSIKWDPLETLKNRGICPVCRKPVTLGVMYRVAELADRGDIESAPSRKAYYSITQLDDILAEIHQVKSTGSAKIRDAYMKIVERLGPEFSIILEKDIREIEEAGHEILAEAVKRLRNGSVYIEEGYDGEFGRIKLFRGDEIHAFRGKNLFTAPSLVRAARKDINDDTWKKIFSIKFDIGEFKVLKEKIGTPDAAAKPLEEDMKDGDTMQRLSDEQKRGVEFFKENCLIIAGPGSGKTRMLTERIFYLINGRSVDPGNILAITFSNRAAGEIAERLEGRPGCSGTTTSTIHAFGLQVLKKYSAHFSRNDDFTIIDDDDKKHLLLSIGVDNKKTGPIIKEISSVKNGAAGPADSNDIMERYGKALADINAFDLDDLIYLPLKLFRDNREILDEYKNRFTWVLVDEFQDINTSQYELITLLADGETSMLYAIGDPDQAIYGFRGSDYRFMERLTTDYPGIRELKLTRSFRCPEKILKTGGHVIGKSGVPEGKRDKLKVQIAGMETERSESDWIAAAIEGMMGGVRSFSMDSGMSDGTSLEPGTGFGDFAILCRASFMFGPLIEALENHGVAYQVIDTIPFYKKKPVSGYIDFLKNLLGPKVPDIKKIMDPYISDLISSREPLAIILGELINRHTPETGLEPLSQNNIDDLMSLGQNFGNRYNDFLRALSMNQGMDDYHVHREAVSLITLHSSKGLEFRTVFIPGCEDGIIPFEIFETLDDDKLNEERRLLYVGITRSLKNLFLTYARSRKYRRRILKNTKSRFLTDIEKDLIDYHQRKARTRSDGAGGQLDLFGDK